MQAPWATALFTDTQRSVLGLLFGNPGRSYFMNEILRAAGKGVGAVHRELSRLVAARLVNSTRRGNQRHFQANADAPVFAELVAMFTRSEAMQPLAPGIAETHAAYTVGGNLNIPKRTLSRFCRKHHIQRLSLFGSVTRHDFGPGSDIDILAEFEPGQAPGLAGLAELQEQLSEIFGGRKVDLATQTILNNPFRRKAVEKDLRVIHVA